MVENTTRVMIINNRNDYFEYEFVSVPATEDAINLYIKNVLGFDNYFALSESLWDSIKDTVTDLSLKIELVNGLCKVDRYRINRVLTGYTTTYSAANTDSADGVQYRLADDGSYLVVTGYTGQQEQLEISKQLEINDGGAIKELPIQEIAAEAFKNNDKLTSVTIPDSVTTIGDGAFRNCDSLTGIWVDADNPSYSSDTKGVLFNKNKTTLIQAPGAISGSYDIPDGVTEIDNNAFRSCIDLTNVTIPNSVIYIGTSTFHSCTNLTSVTVGSSIDTIGSWAFSSCIRLTSVHIPDLAAWCEIKFADNTANPLCYANNLYLNGQPVTNLVIPDSVTTISEYAFVNCTCFDEITIPDSVISIGDLAFYGCAGLCQAVIPHSVTSVGDQAFSGCTSMTAIRVAENNQNYSSDDQGVLFNKDKSILIQAPGSITGSYDIPDGVITVGNCAFNECNSIVVISIPASVTRIEQSAFETCQSLATVNYSGDQESWSKIDIAEYNNNTFDSVTINFSA